MLIGLKHIGTNTVFKKQKRLLPSVLICVLAVSSVVQQAWSNSLLYRYTTDEGAMVIDDKIPPEFVKNGYEIINIQGKVVQKVPRQLTAEEIRLQNTDEARARLKEEEERRLKEWDESLLLRYSTTEDIEAAQERAIRDLNIRISILKSNLKSTQGQIESLQREAADIERRGQALPQAIIANTETLRLEMEDIQESIQSRNQEIDQVKASYQRDIERFSLLQDRVKVRSRSRY